MRIHHLTAATLCPLSAQLVNGAGGLLSPGHLVCHCWLIEASDGLILVDTGIGTADLADVRGRMGAWFAALVRPSVDPACTALARVKQLGFEPRDVRHIVPTHLDLDHAGGLPDFPWATVHCHRDEHAAALAPRTLKDRERYRPQHFVHGPKWDLRGDEGEGWFGFTGVRALDGRDDVLLIPLFGHTRGHCGVAVKTRRGWSLHAGDAYFHHGEMEAPPRCTPALAAFQRIVVTDNRQRLENQQRLRELVAAQRDEVEVHSAHCPVEFERACELPA
jgi:glyoxylase-like metal-dependent hydrolase (beta-lactamase superfamily II)